MTPDPYPPFDGVEPYGTVRSVADERAHRKRMCALGYRIFGALEAACGSLMMGWSTALIFAAVSRSVDRGGA